MQHQHNEEEKIQFFVEEPLIFDWQNDPKFVVWLQNIATAEGFEIDMLNYIFCTDEYLYEINMRYLQHDTYTDIITFDNSEEEKYVQGDIFVSIERVKENAQDRNLPFEQELKRVMAHGILHLCGYKDKTPKQAALMRSKEDWAITIF